MSSFAVASGGTQVLLDPLAPPPSARAAWDLIEAFAADTVVILKPDHVRDVDLFVRWYGARAFGPVSCSGATISRRRARVPPAGRRTARRPASRSTTAAGCSRRRSISPSSARSCSPTPSPRPATASCGCGPRRGTGHRALPALREHARAAVRARARLPRRAGPHPRGLRRRARPRALLRARGRLTDEFGVCRRGTRHDQDLHRREHVPRRVRLGPDESGFDLLFDWYNNGDVVVETARPDLTMTLRSPAPRTSAT